MADTTLTRPLKGGDDFVAQLAKYHRNSLADESLLSEKPDDGIPIPGQGVLDKGAVPAIVARRLRAGYLQSRPQKKVPEHELFVPVIVFANGLAPGHEHAATKHGRTRKVHYILAIPATLAPDDRLAPDADRRPWMRRQFLEPSVVDIDLPIVGHITDFDSFLDTNEQDRTSWSATVKWCGSMVAAVARELPADFHPVDGVAITVVRGGADATRHLRTLYDAIVDEPNPPALFARLCQGTEPLILPPTARLEHMAHPRGTMTAAYGLAECQTEAVIAAFLIKNGEALAVNGPPGTGKTTLIQSIVATSCVETALAGGDPAIIVGASTNNHAVRNIITAMAATLSTNTGDLQPWARRWINEADSLGLYLPAASQTEKAIENGDCYASIGGDFWMGFPEKERDKAFVAAAEASWTGGFEETYGEPPLGLDGGAEHIRSDLARLAGNLVQVQRRLNRFTTLASLWAGRCEGGETPAKCVGRLSGDLNRQSAEARARVAALHAATVRALEQHGVASDALEAEWDAGPARIAAASSRCDAAEILRSRIESALLPRGTLEFCAMAIKGRLQQIAATKQCGRAVATLAAHEVELFRDILACGDPNEWRTRASEIADRAKEDIEQTKRDGDALLASLESRAEEAAFEWSVAGDDARQAREDADKLIRNLQEEEGRLRAESRDLDAARVEMARYHAELIGPDLLRTPTVDVSRWVDEIDKKLDRTIRYELFQKALRYWEGRWIVEAKAECEKSEEYPNEANTLARLRRWSMITPCIISTLHSLPGHMTYKKFVKKGAGGSGEYSRPHLYGAIDVLIVDEAGQVGGHLGMASTALAKRLVAIGDTMQIDPVILTTPAIDAANLFSAGLDELWPDGFPVSPHVLSADQNRQSGSLMRIAQAATTFSADGAPAPGMFLSEHRRCDVAIVEFCNRFYGGRLISPSKEDRQKAPGLSAWNWGHVRGMCAKGGGGSNVNVIEAKVIANWIAARAGGDDGLIAHYGKPLKDIIAVITPFSAQATAIQSALKEHNLSDITVGTVHRLQGAERNLIIFSPTYSTIPNHPGRMFFDYKPNMLNVAASRARDSFIVIGDMNLFAHGTGTPSSQLAEHFLHPENELPDIDLSPCFPKDVLQGELAERIASLAGHTSALAAAIASLKDETVVIMSPWITLNAVKADDVGRLARESVQRGNRIVVVVSGEKVARTPAYQGDEAIEILTRAGAHVHRTSKPFHNKSIITPYREIIEGSFNWLSACRKEDRASLESSWRIRGEYAERAIGGVVKELERLGVRLDA